MYLEKIYLGFLIVANIIVLIMLYKVTREMRSRSVDEMLQEHRNNQLNKKS